MASSFAAIPCRKVHPDMPRFFPVFLLFAACCCGTLFADSDDSAPVGGPAFDSATYDRVNATAHGLAGLAAGGSWESTVAWKEYQEWVDNRWSYMNRIRLNAMRNWGGGALGDLRDARTVYYPFSGPDFLYANTLFPDSKYLLMAGLEPVGSMPDFAALQQQGRLPAYLGTVRTSLYTILTASFFKTKDMKSDFSNGLVDGLMPAMVVFLAHQGYNIDSIHYVSLESDGTLRPRGPGASGVQIAYFRGDRDNLHYLLYFQADLGNDGDPGYLRLMRRLGPGVTYLKAASYLLYEDYFSRIRDAILNDSIGVVEDDSGIPLRDFKPSMWTVTAYGNYTGPINLFKQYYQPDLAAFYAKASPSALPFGSGYKFVASGSSLLVARKK
jgi:hypothetical protein